MTYQETLKDQLERRVRINPQYSLRAFAKFLNMSPSKLSEVLNMKRGVSLAKAHEIGARLKLSQANLEFFVLSVTAQHSRNKKDKIKAQALLKELVKEVVEKKSSQRNAWYFGATKLLEKSGINNIAMLTKILSLTKLQVENAKRFTKRIQKYHPEVTEINYEPESVLKKIQELHISREDLTLSETEFLLLSKEELKLLVKSIKKTD